MRRFKKTDSLVKRMMIISVIFFLTGCNSPIDLGVYDESVPPEQQCTLIIDKTLLVGFFDDKEVHWGDTDFAARTIIQIPAGNHSFWVYFQIGLHGADIDIGPYTFHAGRTYKMSLKRAKLSESPQVEILENIIK